MNSAHPEVQLKALTFPAVYPDLEEFLREFRLPKVLVAVRDHGTQDTVMVVRAIHRLPKDEPGEAELLAGKRGGEGKVGIALTSTGRPILISIFLFRSPSEASLVSIFHPRVSVLRFRGAT